jgi:enoyl-CoA hydratase/carnithine racemase
MTEFVTRHVENGVMQLRLNRPEKKNALTLAMYEALAEGLQAAAEDPDVRVVLLAGGADFTAGNDLKDFAAAGNQETRPSSAFDFLRVIRVFPKPVVAAVRGVSVGIGTTMLLHCDVVIASATARFQIPFTRLGVTPEGGSSILLAQRVGDARARWLLMAGEAFSGEQAARWGLALEAPADAEVEAVAMERARTLAALPPMALAESKRLLLAPQRDKLAEVMDEERVVFSAALRSPEAQAAFQAFLSKAKG